jgi:excisionase family DNA binding protein
MRTGQRQHTVYREGVPSLLTLPEVARALRVADSTAHRLAARGELPSIRFGHSVRVRSDVLRRLLDSGEVQT